MGVDAVICPTAPSASYRKGEGRYFGYTGAWNVLDYAVAVVRTRTTCDAKLDAHVEKNSFLNDSDKAIANDCKLNGLVRGGVTSC
jgi:amidase